MGRRKNGQGLIRQRKDGRWEGRCVVGYDEKNLPITKNVLAKTKREVEEKLKALKETVPISIVRAFSRCLPIWIWGISPRLSSRIIVR